MPSASRIGVPCRKRDSGVTSSRSMPSADQSRCASSISLSDLLIQTARRRPLQPVVEQDAGDLPALARAGAVAKNQPRRKRTAFSASSRAAATTSKVSSTVQEPARSSACASPA